MVASLDHFWRALGNQKVTDDVHDDRKVLIVTLTALQANATARANGWETWQFVRDVQTLYGQSNIRVVFAGTWFQRNDHSRIVEEVDRMVEQGKAEKVWVTY